MKKILITGAGSYIGTSFEKYVSDNYPDEFAIQTADMLDTGWRERNFGGYDTIFHVAGIAHADISDVSEETKLRYYKVNTELAIETAQKAKQDGAKQFIFMSSMIVYGGLEHISCDTEPKPANFYGDSKWQADKAIQAMEDESFHTVVLRPPMIYGKNSKGNYPTLAKMARKLPFFPKVNNQRSMLYIENLCECVRLIVNYEMHGVFFPQNSRTVNTSQLVKMIAEASGHKIYLLSGLSVFIILGEKIPGKIGNLCRKAFGDSYYDMDMSTIGYPYQLVDFEESVKRTEGK